MKAWIARDKDGALYIFWKDKPYKDDTTNAWVHNSYCHEEVNEDIYNIPSDIDPQWEDEEPIEVEINITKAK